MVGGLEEGAEEALAQHLNVLLRRQGALLVEEGHILPELDGGRLQGGGGGGGGEGWLQVNPQPHPASAQQTRSVPSPAAVPAMVNRVCTKPESSLNWGLGGRAGGCKSLDELGRPRWARQDHSWAHLAQDLLGCHPLLVDVRHGAAKGLQELLHKLCLRKSRKRLEREREEGGGD